MLYSMRPRHTAALCALAGSAVALHLPQHATLVSRQDVSTTDYDFVIAGGGISALTVADRLTEDPNGMCLTPLMPSKLYGRDMIVPKNNVFTIM